MGSKLLAQGALNSELQRLAGAAPGERNGALNTSAFRMGQLIVRDGLNEAEVRRRLLETTRPWNGIPGHDGERWTEAGALRTIDSGVTAGKAKPRVDSHAPGWRPPPLPNAAPGDDIATSTPLEFLTLAQLRAKVAAAGPRKWLLRGVWPAGDYGVHAAEMKAQKTWNAVDLAVSVASGTDWLGAVPVDQPGPVLMFAGEGSEANLVRRIDAICSSRRIDPDPLDITICTRSPKLAEDAHMFLFWDQVHNTEPALVTLDPFYLSARGANTRDLVEMGGLLERAQHTCQDHGAALFVVTHHNRNAGATGPMRITGAGPAEWGRVLITGQVKTRRTDPDTSETTVVTELEVIGGEVPGGTWRLTRRIRADDPDDLDSPLHYQVTAHEREPDAGDDTGDMSPVRRKILAALQAADGPRTIKQLQDWIAGHAADGIVPRRNTCSQELNALLRDGLADEIDPGPGRPKQWIAIGEEVSQRVATPDG